MAANPHSDRMHKYTVRGPSSPLPLQQRIERGYAHTSAAGGHDDAVLSIHKRPLQRNKPVTEQLKVTRTRPSRYRR